MEKELNEANTQKYSKETTKNSLYAFKHYFVKELFGTKNKNYGRKQRNTYLNKNLIAS